MSIKISPQQPRRGDSRKATVGVSLFSKASFLILSLSLSLRSMGVIFFVGMFNLHSFRPRTIFDEDEESLTELSNTNDDDYVNMIKYGQLFELRRKCSLAQCPTSMTNEASSLYLFQNIERILHSMDIDDDFALPAIKKTEGWKRSISRQKIVEVSMIFGQVLLLTLFF